MHQTKQGKEKKQKTKKNNKKRKKQSTYIKRDEINIMNIINKNTFHVHNSLLNMNNWYMTVTRNSKLS